MLLLAIDTSGRSGGVTLAQGDSKSFQIVESAPIAGGTFSAQLVPVVASLLQKHGFSAHDLGGLAAASGPGSFTGLRVGLSAIKGLAEVLQKPIATVSLLEALAVLSGKNGRVAAAMEAGRGEFYFGLYEIATSKAARLREELLTPAELVSAIHEAQPVCLATSDAAVIELVTSAGVSVEQVARPSSEDIARLGLRKLLAGETVSTEALDANYIRRAEAEIVKDRVTK